MRIKQIDRNFTGRILICLVAVVLLGVGCNPVAHIPEIGKNDLAGYKPMYAPSGEASYKLVPNDQLSIRFPYHPESDPKGVTTVGPDGLITLEVIGSIPAAGLTPEQLAKVIAEKSSGRLKDPEVIVTVGGYAQKRVYVGGQVKGPGVVLLQDNLTPLQAIFERGGFTDVAQIDSVILIRDANSQNPKIVRLNVHGAMENAVPEQVALLPNDILYVPMTGVGRANLWVKQHIRDLIPREWLGPPTLGQAFPLH